MLSPIFITRYQKEESPRFLHPRFCQPEDLAALLRLQDRIQAYLPDPSIFVATEPEEWQVLLSASQPQVLGLWDENRLTAYGIFLLCGTSSENYGWKLPIPGDQVPFWANMDTIAVDPDYRGNGLERQILNQMETLCPHWIRGFCCTVSPDNPHSLNNVQKAGYEIVTRTPMYQGYDRYILKKERD